MSRLRELLKQLWALLHVAFPSRGITAERTMGRSKSSWNGADRRSKQHAHSLPLGIYFHENDAVSLVWAKFDGADLTVEQSAYVTFKEESPEARNQKCTAILLDIIRERGISERRCVIGISPEIVSTRPLLIASTLTAREIRRSAELYAGEMVTYPAPERAISVDPIPDDKMHRMVSVAKLSEVHRLLKVATDAALIPHAIDGPIAAWDRMCPRADAILDVYHGAPYIVIRRNPHATGVMHVLPSGMQPERIAKEALDFLRKQRELHVKIVERLTVYGPPDLAERVREKLASADKSLTVEPLLVGQEDSPPWAYALALATWDIEPQISEVRTAA